MVWKRRRDASRVFCPPHLLYVPTSLCQYHLRISSTKRIRSINLRPSRIYSTKFSSLPDRPCQGHGERGPKQHHNGSPFAVSTYHSTVHGDSGHRANSLVIRIRIVRWRSRTPAPPTRLNGNMCSEDARWRRLVGAGEALLITARLSMKTRCASSCSAREHQFHVPRRSEHFRISRS
jgi:hypothetical protein